MIGDGFKSKTRLPKPELAQAGPTISKKPGELNVIKDIKPKIMKGEKIGHYHGLHIMSHFPRV